MRLPFAARRKPDSREAERVHRSLYLGGEGGQSFAETAGVGAGDRASFAGARLQAVLSAVRKAREPTAYILGNLRRSSPNTRHSPKRSMSELCGCHGSDPIQTEKTNSA